MHIPFINIYIETILERMHSSVFGKGTVAPAGATIANTGFIGAFFHSIAPRRIPRDT